MAKSDQFSSLVQEIATLVAAKGEDAAQEKADAIDDLKVVLKENIALGPGRPVRGGRRQRRRHLHPPPGRPRRERRARRARRRHQGPRPRDRRARSPSPSRSYLHRDEVPEAEVAEERATLESITRAEGKPEAALGQDRRRPAHRLVQGAGAPRAELRQGREDRRSPSCSAARRSCGSPRSRSAAEDLSNGGRARAGDGSSSSSRVRRSPAPRATASTATSSGAWRRRSSRSARTSTSTSPSSSAAATSGAA